MTAIAMMLKLLLIASDQLTVRSVRSSSSIIPTDPTFRSHPQAGSVRGADLQRRDNHQIVIIVPDACWWGAPGAATQIGVCSEDGTKMDITQLYTAKTSSEANFIFGGLHQSGTAELPSGTMYMVPDDVMSCTAGWMVDPTADVTFTMPPGATTHYTSLITSGGAYLACDTACPTDVPSSAPSSPSAGPSPASSIAVSSIAPSVSSSGPLISASSTSPDGCNLGRRDRFGRRDACPSIGVVGGSIVSSTITASPTASPDPCVPNGRRGLHARHACPSISAMGDDNDLQGLVWLTLPDPHISVHPHDPIVGNWNAAGPFAHLFSFHAWVPTYLNETFDIAIMGDDTTFTSKTACSLGISTKPTGTEIVTYTLITTSPWATPSGDVNGAYLHC